MKNDEGDRHVLAAAVRGSVGGILTFNLRDFKKDHLSEWDIIAVHPAEYLLTLYAINSGVVVSKLYAIAGQRGMSLEQLLMRLRASVPVFTDQLAEALGFTLDE